MSNVESVLEDLSAEKQELKRLEDAFLKLSQKTSIHKKEETAMQSRLVELKSKAQQVLRDYGQETIDESELIAAQDAVSLTEGSIAGQKNLLGLLENEKTATTEKIKEQKETVRRLEADTWKAVSLVEEEKIKELRAQILRGYIAFRKAGRFAYGRHISVSDFAADMFSGLNFFGDAEQKVVEELKREYSLEK